MLLRLSLNGRADELLNASAPFTYSRALVVSSVSPAAGPALGGTAVTVRGAGFGGTRQDFGGGHSIAPAFSIA